MSPVEPCTFRMLLPCLSQMSHRSRRACGGVKPAGGLVDATYRMEMLDAGEFIRDVDVTADDAGAVTQDAHDAAVLPVGDLVFVGTLQLRPANPPLIFSDRRPASNP